MKKGESKRRRRAARVAKYAIDLGGPEHVGQMDVEQLWDLAAVRENIDRLQALKDRGVSTKEEDDELSRYRWQAHQLRGGLKSGRQAITPLRLPPPQVSMRAAWDGVVRVVRFRDRTDPDSDAHVQRLIAEHPEIAAELAAAAAEPDPHAPADVKLPDAPAPAPAPVSAPDDDLSPTTDNQEKTLQ